MARIFSSTKAASFWTYSSSRSPRMAYDCPKICTFTGALMVVFPVGLAPRYHIQRGTAWHARCNRDLPPRKQGLACAELRAKIFFEAGDDFCGKIVDLRVSERGFAALKRYAHEQGVFSRRHVFSAE